MSYPTVPDVSRKEIKRAGERLVSETGSIGDAEYARRLVAKWRACHLLPLHEAASDLRTQMADLGIDAVVAQRLKRLFRIRRKLQEAGNMNLARMQDIAGLRAIAHSVVDVYQIVDHMGDRSPPPVEVMDTRDYIKTPKDNGYRSVHLALQYKGEDQSPYDGLRIELQVRTNLQHLWASAVEITGMWSGHHIKYDQGEPEWAEFFALTADLIARTEETPSAPQYANESRDDVRTQLATVERQIGAIAYMREEMAGGLTIEGDGAASERDDQGLRLLQIHTSERRLTIESFGPDEQEAASAAYVEAEEQVTFSDGNLMPVLVAVSSGAQLLDAYRSFYWDIAPFADLVEKLLTE